MRPSREFELLPDPQPNSALYRYVPEEWRAEVAAELLAPAGHRHIDASGARPGLNAQIGVQALPRSVARQRLPSCRRRIPRR